MKHGRKKPMNSKRKNRHAALMPYRKIARELGISYQEVMRVEKKALRKLYFALRPFFGNE